jgi:glycosyltransferase involved in cell wall biosynthesis
MACHGLSGACVSSVPRVSVVIPTKNEEGAIGQVIQDVRKVLNGTDSEIVVVDDSSDNTPTEAVRAGAKLVKQVGRGGFGEAIMQGVYWSKGEYVIFMDGDSTYDPADIPKLLEPLIKDEADLVNGDRFANMHRDAMPLLNQIGNRFLTKFGNFLFQTSINDSQSGMKAFRREILKHMALFEKGFEACSELVAEASKAHLRIAEVGITYKPRIGETKLNPVTTGPSIFWSSLKMMLDYRPIILLGGFGLVLWAVGFVVAWPVIITFITENRFIQMGRALIALFCWIVGTVSIFTGLMLNAINTSIERITARAK